MRIFIAGAGEVGTHLAKLLSTERHDIILMDQSPERLEFAYESSFEIMPIVGDPTRIQDLKMAGVGESELFISVTPEESANMVACILASKLGAKKTLGRINNNEYLQPQNQAYFASLGIDEMVFPELLAAQEIAAGIRLPWTRQYWKLFGDKLALVAVRVEDNAPLMGKKLMELSALEAKLFHIVAIKRHNKTVIPAGSDDIQPGDILFFVCEPDNLDSVRSYSGKQNVEVHKVIIMGGSRIAMRTVELLPSDTVVKVIEKNEDKCKYLAETAPGNTVIIRGDGRDPELLKMEGIERSQAFLALTDNSEANVLATLVAKKFNVFRTVARIENMDYLEIAESMQIGNLINKKVLAASSIFRHLLNIDVANAKSLSIAKADALEVVVQPGSKITKAPIREIKIPKGTTLGALMRDNKVMLIQGETQVQAGDLVMLFCLDTPYGQIKNLFS